MGEMGSRTQLSLRERVASSRRDESINSPSKFLLLCINFVIVRLGNGDVQVISDKELMCDDTFL